MSTIIDVAKAAKVSKSTVSLVINRSPLVRPAFRARVEEAIKALGYQPNLSARKLKGGASMTVGVVILNVENPFFSELLRGIESVMEPAGYSSLIASSHDEVEREKLLLERMSARGVDAFIIAPAGRNGDTYNHFAEDKKLPITLVSRRPEGCRLDTVLPDNFGGAFELGKHISQLHRRVLAVDFHRKGNTTSTVRLAGLRKSLAENGYEFADSDLYPVTEFTRDEGHRIGKQLLKRLARKEEPVAIFAQNDMLAIGIVQELHSAGIHIPEQVAVFGFDGLDFLRMGIQDISSIKISALEIGRHAAELTLSRLQNVGDTVTENGKEILVTFQYLPGQTG